MNRLQVINFLDQIIVDYEYMIDLQNIQVSLLKILNNSVNTKVSYHNAFANTAMAL